MKSPFNRFICRPIDNSRFKSGRYTGKDRSSGNRSGFGPNRSHLNWSKTDWSIDFAV